jgi:uncharacterized protein YjlB
MKEEVKKFLEDVTGLGKPKRREIEIARRVPLSRKFRDDGVTPNNAYLPLIVYRAAIVLNPRFDPAAIFEVLFASNRWQNSWRYTMYGYNHFHTSTHECLGLARGRLTALFGGQRGRKIDLEADDVIVIPAGVGHKRVRQSRDLLIVGAYPVNGGKYDELKPRAIAQATAVARIEKVPLPSADPVYGKNGPLLATWRQR